MAKINRQDSIDLLPLSVRLNNCLRRYGIHTIGGIVDFHQSGDWLSIRNMGVKSAAEACEWAEKLQFDEHGNCTFDVDIRVASPEKEVSEIISPKNWCFADVKIKDWQLSNRAKEAVGNAGVENAEQLICLLAHPDDARERLEEYAFLRSAAALERFLQECLHSDSMNADQKALVERADELARRLNCGFVECLHAILCVHSNYPQAQGEVFYFRLYESPYMRTCTKEKILRVLDENDGAVRSDEAALLIHPALGNTTIVEELLLELEAENKVTVGETSIHRLYPSVLYQAEQIDDEKARGMLLGYLNGKTLEENAAVYNITRERVRQIINKTISKWRTQGLIFSEDQYIPVYGKYNFSEEEFRMVFDTPATTYHFLKLASDREQKDKLPLEKALEDPLLSYEIKRRIEKIVYKDYVVADGVRLKKSRPVFVRHVVQTYCRNQIAFDAFLQVYMQFLQQTGLQDEQNLLLESATYKNHLNLADYTLWVTGEKFRYYDIPGRDYEELLQALDVARYMDMEISALKLYRDAPDMMLEYDIRDAYELHNLLKKIWREDLPSVTFKRMPTLEIGKADRDNQVLELLLKYAPISSDDLALKMEEEYGIAAKTARANYFRNFDSFYYNGLYTIDIQPLATEKVAAMQEKMDGDYYSIAAVKALYIKLFPDADASDINPHTLKQLGFRVFSGYVIRNTYGNASEYFRQLLTEKDVVNADEFDRNILSIQAYSETLNALRRNREIVEFGIHKYINIRRLNTSGIRKEEMADYCQAVARVVDRGQYFTIESIRQDGFAHPLDDLGFDEWFYGSVLLEDRERFAYQRIGGTRIFVYGPPSQSVFMDMLHLMLEEKLKMDIFDLHAMLYERYHIHLPMDKLIELIRSSDLYYDTIMEAVYLNYDVYFEEV